MNYRNNDHYYAYLLIITKQLTYNNEKLNQKILNLCIIKIMLSLKIYLKSNNNGS
jgi:hypothetical protein